MLYVIKWILMKLNIVLSYSTSHHCRQLYIYIYRVNQGLVLLCYYIFFILCLQVQSGDSPAKSSSFSPVVLSDGVVVMYVTVISFLISFSFLS